MHSRRALSRILTCSAAPEKLERKDCIMAKPIIMPQVRQDIETGVIVEWRVKENDYVSKGDVVALVESDKATFEVEAYESGVLLKRLYDAGAEVKVLDPIAYVGEPGETIE